MEIKLIKELRAAPETVKVPEGILMKDLMNKYQDMLPYRVLAVKMNNKYEDLDVEVADGSTVEFLDMRNHAASLLYQRSLSMIYLKAIYDVLGKAAVWIANSLNKGLYTEVQFFREVKNEQGATVHREDYINDEEIKKVEARMREIVDKNTPFFRQIITKEEAAKRLMEEGDAEKLKLLKSSTVDSIAVYSLLNYWNFFYGRMAPSTGYIQNFELRPYNEGKAVLLRFPDYPNPEEVPPFEDDFLLSEAFGETKSWGKLMKCPYVSDLNEKIERGAIKDLILISEALHAKKIAEIAKEVIKSKRRIVLIAGPSSSGKTTFAKRLGIQLMVEGLEPLYLGTDDYFLEREETPLDENGDLDFENLCAIDVKLFNRNLRDLLEGEEVDVPVFDFLTGHKNFGSRIISIKEDQPIIIEGIHGLNDMMTPDILSEEKFKIYISPLTNLGIDDHNRISVTDSRMLRRLVRDFKFRGHSAKKTIESWPKVRAGEMNNIFPYNSKADLLFNSAHVYELSVLKKYAAPLLEAIPQSEPEYAEARRMLSFLRFFKVIEEEDIIPNNSILREFIGGSAFMD